MIQEENHVPGVESGRLEQRVGLRSRSAAEEGK